MYATDVGKGVNEKKSVRMRVVVIQLVVEMKEQEGEDGLSFLKISYLASGSDFSTGGATFQASRIQGVNSLRSVLTKVSNSPRDAKEKERFEEQRKSAREECRKVFSTPILHLMKLPVCISLTVLIPVSCRFILSCLGSH